MKFDYSNTFWYSVGDKPLQILHYVDITGIVSIFSYKYSLIPYILYNIISLRVVILVLLYIMK